MPRGELRAAQHPQRRARRGGGGALTAIASRLAEWASPLTYADLPPEVAETTRLRVLDVLGLALAGSVTPLGAAVRASAVTLSPPGRARLAGTGEAVGAATAAFANAACAQALEFDDTHNESIVHMSSPAVASALALADERPVTGREAITAMAIANEIACRVGVVSPGQFHRRGFHPTGLFAPFGTAYGAGRLLGLDQSAMTHAAGLVGSCAAGLLECWVDGTQTKFLHSGWAAQNGIAAALLARAGATGPPTVIEGRFGLFASHLPADAPRQLARVTDGLGTHWESRLASFKPYPAAHVLHPYLDALLRVRARHGLRPDDVEAIDCPVAEFNVSIVCEPVAEKVAPATAAHGRVCLQYTMAEALAHGRLGRDAYGEASRRDPAILALARRVRYHVDPSYPGPGRFKGAVRITLRDGRTIEDVQEYNRGSVENPMSEDELRAKFDDNAAAVLGPAERARLADTILRLDRLDDASAVLEASLARTATSGPGAGMA